MVPFALSRTAFSPFGRRDVFGEFRRFNDQINALFNGVSNGFNGVSSGYPALRIYQNDDEALVEALLPGVQLADLELKVEDQILTLSGERRVQEEEGQKTQRRQRFGGRFSRRVELPFEVDTGRVEARLQNGVLRVRLPKAQAVKPRRIEIQAA